VILDRVERIWALIAGRIQGTAVTVADVCQAAVTATGMEGAAVSVIVSPIVRDAVYATDQVSRDLEDWQFSSGHGPCLDVVATGCPVLVDDLAEAAWLNRWPDYTPAALRSGARALVALPLQVGAIKLGAFELYRTSPGSLTDDELSDALVFAEAVIAVLLAITADSPPDAAELAWHLQDPTGHHIRAHQATGMIMAAHRLSPAEAFARLRAHAYTHHQRLGDVARDVIGHRLNL
jgi:ANTAR domain